MAEQVGNIANRVRNGSGASAARAHTTAPRLTARQVDRLFLRMANHFGTRWTGRFGTDELLNAARAEWALALGDLGDRDLNHGFRKMLDDPRTEPPSLGEFRGMCRRYANASHRPAKQLALAAPRDPAKAAAAVQRMRVILRNAPDPIVKPPRQITGDEIDAKLMARLLDLGPERPMAFRLRVLGIL